jgi:hypothetical protein
MGLFKRVERAVEAEAIARGHAATFAEREQFMVIGTSHSREEVLAAVEKV